MYESAYPMQKDRSARALRQMCYAIAVPLAVALFFAVSALTRPDGPSQSGTAVIPVASANEPAWRYFPDQFTVERWDESTVIEEYY